MYVINTAGIYMTVKCEEIVYIFQGIKHKSSQQLTYSFLIFQFFY